MWGVAKRPILAEGGAMRPRLTTYTVDQVAELVDRTPVTVRRWIRAGHIKAARIGREYRISEAELERWWRARSGGGSLFGRAEVEGEGRAVPDSEDHTDEWTLDLFEQRKDW
jgi:excisionase family DNA binding protein